ncbi:MAG: hypothetical protein Q8S73_06655 [Deltaproteobacteria bacterium]|nr:hypothetical protein [Myxococcales bacterium]MDP3213764.1 hypothetical protein [Deltaproteobacteria bacterium]
MAPAHAQRWLWLRPRALFDHPQLGPLLSQLTRDAGERALVAEAERGGVEVRTVERALLVERGGASVSFAAGSFDARRVIELHWDRMLPPQRRGAAGAGVERIEGMLGGRPVALSTDAACGLLARADRDPRLVDRLVDRPSGGEPDPAEMVRWHIEGAPTEVESPEAAALTTTLRWTELRADPAADGLRVTIVLAGPLPTNTPARMTRLLLAMAASPLGAAVGADDWLHPTDAAWSHAGDEWRGGFVIPWRGLRALVGLARGAVEAPDRREF